MQSMSLRTALLTLLSTGVFAHTWNEQLTIIGDNGSFVGAFGYPRGYMARTDPGFDGETDKYILPTLESGKTAIDETDYLCHPSQRTQNQTQNYPRLQVAPGSWVAFRQLENGHVSLPQNQPGKPDNRGTVYVYATSQPKDDEKIADVLQWTKDGSGGDKRGRLIAINDFDDLRCHQMNSGTISQQRQQSFPNPVPNQPGTKTELWCETDAQIPSDTSFVQPGKLLTVYWIWDWPYLPGSPGQPAGKQEWYTTCSDLEVVDQAPEGPQSNTLVQQDPMNAAVTNYKSRPAKYTVPSYFTWSINGSPPIKAPNNNAPLTATSTPTPTPTSGNEGQGQGQGTVLTALITVIATLAPGQTAVTVTGNHEVTFVQAPSSASTLVSTVTSTQTSTETSTQTGSPLGLQPLQLPTGSPSASPSPSDSASPSSSTSTSVQSSMSMITVTIAPMPTATAQATAASTEAEDEGAEIVVPGANQILGTILAPVSPSPSGKILRRSAKFVFTH